MGQLAPLLPQTYGAHVGLPAVLTRVQAPFMVAPRDAAHASHCPEQALSQQKPSEQNPVEQESAAPATAVPSHAEPVAIFATHAPAPLQ